MLLSQGIKKERYQTALYGVPEAEFIKAGH
jgi:hypothetical protein